MLKLSIQEMKGYAHSTYRVVVHPGPRDSYEDFLKFCVNGSTVARSDVKAVMQCAEEYILHCAANGRECDLGPLGRSRLGVRGVYTERPLRIEDAEIQYNIYWILRSELKKRVRDMGRTIQRTLVEPRTHAPRVGKVSAFDRATGKWTPNTWRAGDILLIQGHRLRFDVARLDEGVFVKMKGSKTWQRLENHRDVLPKTIRCLMPADWLGSGELKIDVRTRPNPSDPHPTQLAKYVTVQEIE